MAASNVKKYANAIAHLLPPGKAWEAVRCSPLVTGMAEEFARIELKICNFLDIELDPRKTVDLLPDWEGMLGIPDECTPASQTIAERQEQVFQKLTHLGGSTAEYYEGVAADLGFTVTAEKCTDFRVGKARVGDRLCTDKILEDCIFRVGSSRVGDQLDKWGWRFVFVVNVPTVDFGNELLECTIKKLKLAHTAVVFLEEV